MLDRGLTLGVGSGGGKSEALDEVDGKFSGGALQDSGSGAVSSCSPSRFLRKVNCLRNFLQVSLKLVNVFLRLRTGAADHIP